MKKTVLYPSHVEAGAKIVDYSGWSMPIQYTTIINEQKQCREAVVLFDVSHMGRFSITGENAEIFLHKVFPVSCDNIELNQSKYSFVLNENAGFIDDIILTKRGKNSYDIVANASNKDRVMAWLNQHNQTGAVIEDKSEMLGHIAIQGQNAARLLDEIAEGNVSDLKYYYGKEVKIQQTSCYCSRLGYTGEDGFELILPTEKTIEIWKQLQEKGEKYNIGLAGLGARDILRIEAAMPLYGNDINENYHPIESGLGWAIDYNQSEYLYSEKLNQLKNTPKSRRLVTFKMIDKGIPRHDYIICDEEQNQIGIVTSGTHSPSLNVGIGMGYVNIDSAKVGTKIMIQQKTRMMLAEVVKRPFVNNTK